MTFNLCTQLAKSFAVYYFKCVCHDEYLYSIFGFAIIAEMAGLVFFPKIAEKISREKVYAFACGLPIVGFVLLGAAGYVAPQNKVLVIVCCALLFFGSGLSLGVTTCCMADVIDYGEVKFGVRNESVTCSAQTFLMKAAMAAAGLVEMCGGDNEQILNAAALTLKNIMGLVCDPVAGLVEIPCVKRNAFLSIYAVTGAELALAGIKSVIPLDEIVDAMKQVGEMMSPKLKESSEAGLATTSMGLKITEKLAQKWQNEQ